MKTAGKTNKRINKRKTNGQSDIQTSKQTHRQQERKRNTLSAKSSGGEKYRWDFSEFLVKIEKISVKTEK